MNWRDHFGVMLMNIRVLDYMVPFPRFIPRNPLFADMTQDWESPE